MPRTLFVSDLHLCAEEPAAVAGFVAFVRERAAGAAALYLLGDLFEAWPGDDELAAADADPAARAIAAALSALAETGTAVRLMQGNRDFLIRGAFAAACRGALIPDPVTVPLEGGDALALHGDTLCTEDADYQAWRALSRSDAWQQVFLARPLGERREILQRLRARSRESISRKPADIMDASAAAIEAAFHRHGVRRMIHGHTHRPARHAHVVDGNTCERWVLPAWHGSSGGWLESRDDQLELVRF